MLKQKYVLDFGTKFFMYVVGSLVGIVIARVAGPEVVGTIAYGASFTGMFFFIFGLFGTSHIKLISANQELLGKCIKIYLTLLSISLAVYILVVFTYFFIEKFYFHKEFTYIEQVVIFLFIAINGINGMTKISEVTFVGLTQQAKANIPQLVNMVIYHLGRLTVVLLGYGAIALVSVNLATSILIIPVFFWLMRKFPWRAPWDNELFKQYLTIGAPILIITLTNSVISNYGSIMLKDTSSILELGFFAGGSSLASMLSMMGNSAGTIFFPLFSKAYANNDMNYIKTQIKKYERFLYLFALPLFLTLGVFSDPIIPFLMTDKYLPSVPVFSILVFAAFFSINAMPYNNLLYGVGRFKVSAGLSALFMVVFIGMLFLFLDSRFLGLGAIGLALVMLVHNFFKYMVWYFYAKINFQAKIEFSIILIFFINLLYFGAFYFIKEYYIVGYNIFIYALIALLLLAFFYIILFLIKILNKKDVEFLMGVLNVKKLIDYTKGEMKK